jgi:multiple sugar transport system ATP-binding protein
MLPGTAAIRPEETIQTGIQVADCHLFDEAGIALERRVELTDIDMGVLDPAAA